MKLENRSGESEQSAVKLVAGVLEGLGVPHRVVVEWEDSLPVECRVKPTVHRWHRGQRAGGMLLAKAVQS
mgnify:CR=1 FL=1